MIDLIIRKIFRIPKNHNSFLYKKVIVTHTYQPENAPIIDSAMISENTGLLRKWKGIAILLYKREALVVGWLKST